MSRLRKITLANDNDPRGTFPRGDAAGFKAMLRAKDTARVQPPVQAKRTAQTKHTIAEPFKSAPLMSEPLIPGPEIQARSKAPNLNTPKGIFTALLGLLGATLAAAYTFNTGKSELFSIAALLAMVWTALTISYFAAKPSQETHFENTLVGRKKMRVLSEVSTLIAIVAGLGIWMLASQNMALPATTADGIFGFSALAMLTAAFMQSRLSLFMSCAAALLWVLTYSQTPHLNIVSLMALPILAAFQFFAAGQSGGKLASFITLLAVHLGLALALNTHYIQGNISLLHIAAMCLMIGLAHYRLGKAAGDIGWDSASMHVQFGWGLAIAGALALQNFWLGQNETFWQMLPASPFGNLSWQLIGAGTVALVGAAGMIRMYYNQMSTMAVFLNLGLAVGAAALFDQRELIASVITADMNMTPYPLVGFIIGAAILASALAMAVNGARTKSTAMMIAGLSVIALQFAVLLNPQLWTAETGAAFGLTLIASLCLAAVFAADDAPSYAA